MRFLKENPLLAAIAGISLAVFVVFAALTWMAVGAADKEKSTLESNERKLKNLLAENPAPTTANLEAATANVNALRDELEEVLGRMTGTLTLNENHPTDSTTLILGLRRMVQDFRREGQNRLETSNVLVTFPDNTGLSFERFTAPDSQWPPAGVIAGSPQEQETLADLWLQQQMVRYLLRQLFNSLPANWDAKDEEKNPIPYEFTLIDVEREPAVKIRDDGPDDDGVSTRRAALPPGTFEIDPGISAESKGAIEAIAFRIQFASYTDVMRRFLTEIAKFELPFVVRSVEVEPFKQTSRQRGLNQRPRGGNAPLLDLFGGGGDNADEEMAFDERYDDLVGQNISKFTIVLEYIEVVEQPDIGTTAIASANP